jgi:hypothetical protein
MNSPFQKLIFCHAEIANLSGCSWFLQEQIQCDNLTIAKFSLGYYSQHRRDLQSRPEAFSPFSGFEKEVTERGKP